MTNVVISGTFDRLHDGHKGLLDKGIYIVGCESDGDTPNHLLVEITPWLYVQKFKKFAHMVEREGDRLRAVEKYIAEALEPDQYTVVISGDEYGSAFCSNNLDTIIVGKDTVGWAQMINSYRRDSKMKELAIVVAPDFMVDNVRISSTMLREKEIFNQKMNILF